MIKVVIKDSINKGEMKEVQIERTLAGDYILTEHPEIDVVVMPEKTKVVVLPKTDQTDYVYKIQDRLLTYLTKRGVLDLGSIKAGTIHGALEGTYPKEPPEGENPLQVVVFNVAQFIEDQRPIYTFHQEYEQELEKQLTMPDREESTELGEIPQDTFKGSIPKTGFPTRGIYRYNY
jgi:hypothetical protein